MKIRYVVGNDEDGSCIRVHADTYMKGIVAPAVLH
jgi:hypothetical protein